MKIKSPIYTDTRVSMLQTCMNVAGGNFAGKGVSSKKLLSYAYELYLGILKQIEAAENNEVLQLTVVNPKKKVNKKTAKDLVKKLKSKKR